MNTAESPSAQEQLDLYRACRTDKLVLMFEDLLPKTGKQSIYLTPTFTDSNCVHKQNWHHECREQLRELCYQGLILIPENRINHGGNRHARYLHWCHDALTEASHLIFVFKKNQPIQEVQQTIHQLGIAIGRRTLGSKQEIFVVASSGHIPCPMTKHSLKTAGLSTFYTIPEMLRYLLRT